MREWLSSWIWAFRVYRLLALSCRLQFHFTPAHMAAAGLLTGNGDDPWQGRCSCKERELRRKLNFQTVTPDWERP